MAVSAFRTIVIGEPTIWGWDRLTPPGIPYSWPIATPDDTLDYALDLSVMLTDADDGIVEALVSISPFDDSDLDYDRVFVDGGVVSFWKGGGNPKKNYLARIVCRTSSARQITYDIQMPMRDAQQDCCNPMPPCFGKPVKWKLGDAMFTPAKRLEAVNALATGTTQTGATVVPLSKLFVGAATNTLAGILLPSVEKFCGETMPCVNDSGVPIMFYPHANETIVGKNVNEGFEVQDQGRVDFWVNAAGFLVAS